MRHFLVHLCCVFSTALFVLPLAHASDPQLNPSVNLDTCDCERTANGLCRRWSRSDLSWQLYAPGPETSDVVTADLEHAMIEAFASWQALTCATCAVPGTLPPLAADASPTARPGGDSGCIAAPCDPNPLGLNFDFGGDATEPRLASDCWQSGSNAPCDGSAENSSQVAFLRDDKKWPLSTLTVSTTFLTTGRDGQILDADILLRDTTHVFCYAKCGAAQWDVRAALIVELGNAIGLGSAVTPSGQDVLPEGKLPTYLSPRLTNCACLVYRFSTDPTQCLQPDTSFSCDAGPQNPLPHGTPRWPWLFAFLAGIAVLWRRLRSQRKGLNSSVPQRRA